MKAKVIQFNPSMFIQQPYILCPNCDKNTLGVLTISKEYYQRKCKNCGFDLYKNLPKIMKNIIYIDQFGISNMVKAIHPTMLSKRKSKIDQFWRLLFEKLSKLSKMQLIVCPESTFHYDESIISNFNEELKIMYELLSSNIRFTDPDTIRRFQIADYAEYWFKDKNNSYVQKFDKQNIIIGELNEWNQKIIIKADIKLPFNLIDDQLKYLISSNETISTLFKKWQMETNKNFNYWYDKEIQSFGKTILHSYVKYLKHSADIELGNQEFTINDLFPPKSAEIIAHINDIFLRNGMSEDEAEVMVIDFLLTADFSNVIYNKIESMLWAAVARKAASGQKRLPTRGMTIDIQAISTLMPYCNAMFIDNECNALLSEEPLKTEISYLAKTFSFNNKEKFIEYLDEILDSTREDHIRSAIELYGEDVVNPTINIFS